MLNGPLRRKHSAGRLTTAARAALLPAVTLATAACAGPAPKRAEAEPPHRPSPDSGLVDQPGAPRPGEWTLPGRDYAGTRYSPLDQITAANAGNLRLAWSFSTGFARGFEGQPLVVAGMMYVVTPYPNKVFAIDLSRPGGPLRWSYTPPTDPASQGEACCDVVPEPRFLGRSHAGERMIRNRRPDNVASRVTRGGTPGAAWSDRRRLAALRSPGTSP